MSTRFGPGFDVAVGRAVDTSAYDRYVGRWSRLFVPTVLAAAEVAPRCRVLDVSTGTGEAALMMLPIVGTSGVVIGADISLAMLQGTRQRLNESSFWPVAACRRSLAAPKPDPLRLLLDLRDAGGNLILGNRAHRVVDHDRLQPQHSERLLS